MLILRTILPFVLTFIVAASAHALPWKKAIDSKVVEVLRVTERGKSYAAMAFSISDTELISAAHVCRAYSDDAYLISKDRGILLVPVYMSKDQDLCYISARNPYKHLKIARKPPRWNSKLFAYGNPMATSRLLTQGYAGRVVYPERLLVEARVTSIPICRGNSGGPIINKWGRVVGVASFIRGAGMGDCSHVSFTPTLRSIKKFLKKARSRDKMEVGKENKNG